MGIRRKEDSVLFIQDWNQVYRLHTFPSVLILATLVSREDPREHHLCHHLCLDSSTGRSITLSYTLWMDICLSACLPICLTNLLFFFLILICLSIVWLSLLSISTMDSAHIEIHAERKGLPEHQGTPSKRACFLSSSPRSQVKVLIQLSRTCGWVTEVPLWTYATPLPRFLLKQVCAYLYILDFVGFLGINHWNTVWSFV